MKRDRRGKSDNTYIFTRETMGLTLILFSAIVLVMLFSYDIVFDKVGMAVCSFLYGTFGYGSIPLMIAIAYLGFWLAFEKSIKISFRSTLFIALTVFCVFMLFHAVTTREYESVSYGAYLSDCYNSASVGWSGYTFGGVISGLLVYPVAYAGGYIVAYIAFAVLTILFGYLSYLSFKKVSLKEAVKVKATNRKKNAEEIAAAREDKPRSSVEVDHLYTVNPNNEIVQTRVYGQNTTQQPVQQYQNIQSSQSVQPQGQPIQQYQQPVYNQTPQIIQRPAYNQTPQIIQQPSYNQSPQIIQQPAMQQNNKILAADEDKYSRKNLGRKIIFEKGEFAAESYRRNMIFSEESYFNHPVSNEGDYLSSFSSGEKKSVPSSYSESYQKDIAEKPSFGAPTGYIYGEKPVENLGSFGAGQGSSYSLGGNSYTDRELVQEFQAPEYFDDKPADLQLNTNYEEKASGDKFNPIQEDNYLVNENNYSDPLVVDDSNAGTADAGETFRKEENIQEPFSGTAERESSFGEKPVNDFSNIFGADSLRIDRRVEPDTSRLTNRSERLNPERPTTERSNSELFDNDEDDVFEIKPERERSERLNAVDEVVSAPRRLSNEIKNEIKKEQSVPDNKPEEKPKHVWKKYVHPPMDLLDDYPETNNVNTGEIENNKRIIVETLERFKIVSEISNVTIGPAITRYDVVIEDKVNIKRSLSYRETISMALMKDNVNAYLNYSKGALSIEVPNNARAIVGLKNMLTSPKFINAKKNSLTFALGKNVEGEVVCPDITKMPHLLVAGTTGSGKSICLSSLLISLLYKYGPEELRLILVDPKQVEFISYDKLPHLMINEILYDVDKALKALNWAVKEMERRYSLFKEMTEAGTATKNLEEYNSHLPEGEEKLPKILIVLDEFGDLMLQAKKEIEGKIIKLVQKARACGIHLILATQRPSVDCITGLIKSNLPTRIGFKVNSFDDSRTIFDIGGAEKLLGMGDMYFRSTDNPDLARIQGCFVNTHEVQKVTDFIKANNETYFDQSVSDFINTVEQPETSAAPADGGEEVAETKIDDTFIKALKYCVTSNQASVSMIQRRFPVGYIKACKIIDWMEDMNYITKSEGSKPRKVLLSKEEFVNTYGEDVDD